jgi:hypothetical protein
MAPPRATLRRHPYPQLVGPADLARVERWIDVDEVRAPGGQTAQDVEVVAEMYVMHGTRIRAASRSLPGGGWPQR